MVRRELPARPSLEQYRKQAKELLTGVRSGDPAALSRVREQQHRVRGIADPELRRVIRLADAQFVIAREHGFESWPKFARHIEAVVETGSPDRTWLQAERATVAGDADTLDALLREHGAMLRSGPVLSTWWGGLAPNYSEGDARTIIAREHHFESWEQFAAHADAMRDRNSPAAQFEAAVDAVVTGDVAALERALLANPDLVRARSARTHKSTLLHYVGANGVEGFRQRTPPTAVTIARVLLDAGADVNAVAGMYGGSDTLGLVATSIHPVTAGVQQELLAFLLDRGASVGNAEGSAAWSSLINAAHANGRPAAAEFLAARAPALDLEAAAGVGYLEVVKSFFNDEGGLTANATQQQMTDGFAWACEYGRTDVVRFLLQQGMNVAAKLRHDGQTGLHWAAFGGHVDTVRVLLEFDAPVNATDDSYGGTPLGWALYGWGGGPRPRAARYYDTVTLLVAAGATFDESWLEAPERESPAAKMVREDARMLAALGITR